MNCNCFACRSCESPIERKLMHAFLDVGIFPITQYRIGRYRVDFLFWEEKVIVEADGRQFHSSLRARFRGKRRDTYLRKKGYTVIHFTGSEIFRFPIKCARKIKLLLRGR